MGSGPTQWKKNEVARIVEGVKKTGAIGTFEFQLIEGIVKFHMTGESLPTGPTPVNQSPNPWDKVLSDGKAKPSLAVLKKIPR